MTFDEVIKGLRGNRLSDEITIGDTIKIIKTLKDQYAPTVEMTKKQWDEFNTIRNESVSFSDLWSTIFKQGKAWHSITDLSERTLMIAWLDDDNVEIIPNTKWFVRSKEKK